MYCFRTEDDLDLLKIAESGQCFRWNKTEDHCFRVVHAGYCVYIEETGAGEYRLDCTEEEFQAVWSPYLDLDLDYRKVRKRIKKRSQRRDPGKGISTATMTNTLTELKRKRRTKKGNFLPLFCFPREGGYGII